MNDVNYRRAVIEALGGSGPIGNEKQYWNTLLSSLDYTGDPVATEDAFWRAFANAIGAYDGGLTATQTVVSDNDQVTVGGSTYTFTVAGGEITNIVVT